MRKYILLLILFVSCFSDIFAVNIYEDTSLDYIVSEQTENWVLDNGGGGIFSGYRSELRPRPEGSLGWWYEWTIAREGDRLYFRRPQGGLNKSQSIGDFKLLGLRCGIDKNSIYTMVNDGRYVFEDNTINRATVQACGSECEYIIDNTKVYKQEVKKKNNDYIEAIHYTFMTGRDNSKVICEDMFPSLYGYDLRDSQEVIQDGRVISEEKSRLRKMIDWIKNIFR